VFDDAAQVVVPLAVAKAKTAWRNAVNAIRNGGGTNLTAGWMLGRDELAKAPESFSRRLLLLTDGQLNVGIAASGLERQGVRPVVIRRADPKARLAVDPMPLPWPIDFSIRAGRCARCWHPIPREGGRRNRQSCCAG